MSCKQVADPLELAAMMQWINCEYDKALSIYVHVFQKAASKPFCYFLSTSFKDLQPTPKAKREKREKRFPEPNRAE